MTPSIPNTWHPSGTIRYHTLTYAQPFGLKKRRTLPELLVKPLGVMESCLLQPDAHPLLQRAHAAVLSAAGGAEGPEAAAAVREGHSLVGGVPSQLRVSVPPVVPAGIR
eukprot:2571265-Pyramimonas_sp.AAC.1